MATTTIDSSVLKGFRSESMGLLVDLQLAMGEIEGGGALDVTALREYGQKVDRVMGTAKMFLMMDRGHVGIQEISRLTELGKQIAYSAAEVPKPAEVPGLVKALCRLAWVLGSLAEAVEDDIETRRIASELVPPLLGELEALKSKLPIVARPKGL